MQKLFFVSIFLLVSIDLIKAQVDVPGDLENEYFQLLALKNQQVNHLGYGLTIDPFFDSLEWSLWDRFQSKINVTEGLTLLDLGFKTHIIQLIHEVTTTAPLGGGEASLRKSTWGCV